jgi:hypothetical protein
MAELKYLGMALTNKTLIREDVERRYNSRGWGCCYYPVQNLLSSRLLRRRKRLKDTEL